MQSFSMIFSERFLANFDKSLIIGLFKGFLYLLQRDSQASAIESLLSDCRAQLLLSKEIRKRAQ